MSQPHALTHHPNNYIEEVKKAKQNAHLINTAITAGGAVLTGAAAVGVNEAIKTKKAKKLGKSVAEQTNSIKKSIIPKGSSVDKQITALVNNKTVKSISSFVSNKTQKVVNYVKGMNKKVALAAGAGIALVAAGGIYKAGQIEGRDKDANEFIKVANKFTEALMEVKDSILLLIIDNNENE